jgi:hypothetical protein
VRSYLVKPILSSGQLTAICRVLGSPPDESALTPPPEKHSVVPGPLSTLSAEDNLTHQRVAADML